ncbi:osteoclast stimulatory transmembrane protein-like [Chiloscyllium plagiosum]|uniref:osteoclast stimulatory transmembrane protein-like n=1 Tax=Chiloscyllium plagiosum TaxID=36176 RepID=UPI001CB7CF63|nr:osteoclast stimulatory transmembrane protein-like [Chiloscyllium plagiosum]
MHKYRILEKPFSCGSKWAQKMKEFMRFAWVTYSKPTPDDWRELLVLFLLCSSICAIIGGLLYNWMFSSLKYGSLASNIITCIFTGAMFLLLFLVHPVRCVFTMVIPTLGSKQGRDLLFSTCFMLSAINIIPNFMGNIKMILQVMQCIALTSAQSLVNSTNFLKQIKLSMDKDIAYLFEQISKSNVVSKSKAEWRVNSDIEMLAIKNHLQVIGNEIQGNLSTIQGIFDETTLNTNRVLAGFVFFYLSLTSAWYLKGYLTDLQFDNVYITSRLAQLMQTDKAKLMQLGRTSSKKLIKSTGLKMSPDETARCVKQFVICTVFLALSAIFIAADFIVFNLTSNILLQIAVLPPVPITLELTFVVNMVIPLITSRSLINRKPQFHWDFIFVSDVCTFHPSYPNIKVICIVCLLHTIAYMTVFLETYALRIRRKISAAFFEQREVERINYLHQKILTDSEHQFENKTAVFSVSEQCNVTFE